MGGILDSVRRHVPASYRALVSSSSAVTYNYGVTQLQSLANFVQFRLFSTVAGESNEATVYDYKRLELLGMLTTMQFIPAAVDYWGDQINSEVASGTRETVLYFDRRKELWNVFKRLEQEARQLAIEIGVSVGVGAIVPKVSYGDNGRNILLTQDPQDWPAAYETTTLQDLLPWRSV